MIGQVKFSWINFRRSFITSFSQYLNLILTYIFVGISVNSIFIVKGFFKGNIAYRFKQMYVIFSIIGFITALIISIIITKKTIKQIFNRQLKDVSLMKNVGSKSKWIYSYIMFYHILVGAIAFVIGLFISALSLLIILCAFNMESFGYNIKFLPVVASCIFVLVVHYLIIHNEIIRILDENNLERSSKGLKNYKSIFEFDDIFRKIKVSGKYALKAYLRSGEIRETFVFIFLISTASIIFLFSTIIIGNSFVYSLNKQFSNYDYLVGSEDVTSFFQSNIGYSERNYTEVFTQKSSLNTPLLNSLEKLNVSYYRLFYNKRYVWEINVTIPVSSGGTSPDSTNEGQYQTIGKERNLNISIVGYVNEEIFLERLLEGEIPDSNKNEIIVSQAVNKELLDDYTLEYIRIKGLKERYKVTGIISENWANGYTIYIPMKKLKENGLTNNGNCVLIKSSENIDINKLNAAVEENNYKMLDIKKTIKEKEKDLKNVLNAVNAIYGVLFVITITRFLVFGILVTNEHLDDIKLLYNVGANSKKIKKCMLRNMDLNIFLGFFLSFLIGIVILRYFIAEENVTKFLGFKIMALLFTNYAIAYLGVIIGLKGSKLNKK